MNSKEKVNLQIVVVTCDWPECNFTDSMATLTFNRLVVLLAISPSEELSLFQTSLNSDSRVKMNYWIIHLLKMWFFSDLNLFLSPQNLPINTNRRVPNPDSQTALSTGIEISAYSGSPSKLGQGRGFFRGTTTWDLPSNLSLLSLLDTWEIFTMVTMENNQHKTSSKTTSRGHYKRVR